MAHRTCSIPGCDQPYEARGWCRRHYKRARLYGDPEAPDRRLKRGTCSVDECDKPHLARGWCAAHYRRWKLYGHPHGEAAKTPTVCTVAGCDKPYLARGWCGMHYARWKAHGDPSAGAFVPAKQPYLHGCCEWCGDPIVTSDRCGKNRRFCNRACASRARGAARQRRTTNLGGYVLIWAPDHPLAMKAGYVLEHRLVAMNMLGRPLLKGEVVHHKNGVKADNRPENLEVMTASDHARLRRALTQCPHCGESL